MHYSWHYDKPCLGNHPVYFKGIAEDFPEFKKRTSVSTFQKNAIVQHSTCVCTREHARAQFFTCTLCLQVAGDIAHTLAGPVV